MSEVEVAAQDTTVPVIDIERLFEHFDSGPTEKNLEKFSTSTTQT
jgi:hypothetical protein